MVREEPFGDVLFECIELLSVIPILNQSTFYENVLFNVSACLTALNFNPWQICFPLTINTCRFSV